MSKPSKLTIRSYQVGFGDCFLLRFEYPQAKARHVLIDCGSMGRPKNAPDLRKVAAQIAQDCDGKLTALVATHRHADHINGFATRSDGKGAGDILRELKPDLVVQPWTEDPNTKPDALQPGNGRSGSGRNPRLKQFVSSLEQMHSLAEVLVAEIKRFGSRLPAATRAQLGFLGEENIANRSAVENLIRMGRAGQAEYLRYGKRSRLERLLPGVKVHVLGPPTPKQYPEIEQQRARDAAEFWHLLGASARRLEQPGGIVPFDRKFAHGRGGNAQYPPPTRWMINRVLAAHFEQRMEIVRILDDAMNNTSLILLFETGGKRFLFPGDAQIENWSYALQHAKEAAQNRELLKQTDFYKVGHHGSLNATPKSLWALFEKKGAEGKPGRLQSAVSTMGGKHGSSSRETEVPRRTLIAALKEHSDHFSTQSLRSKNKFSEDLIFDF